MRGRSASLARSPNEETDDLVYHRQVFARRRKSLYLFLLIGCAGSVLLLVGLSLAQRFGVTVDNLERLLVAVPIALVVALVSFVLARRGAVTIAAYLFLGTSLLLATFLIEDPGHVVEGRALLAYLVIIVASGLLLPPHTTFLFAGLATICVLLLSLQIGRASMQPFVDALDFFAVATITWYFADRLERANFGLSRSRQELRALNADLEQRVDERTAELRRVNAELEGSNRIKDEFLATVSHELRTPLTAILALSDTLSEQIYGPLTPRQLRAALSIRASGHRLRKLIDEMLDFSQLEAGVLVVDLELLPVQEVCQAALGAVQELAAARQQQLAFRCEVPDDAAVYADPGRLQQALGGLLDNAVKFTAAGGALGLDVLPGPQPGTLQFVVWDTGIGITPEDLPHLFEPFHQLDRRLSRSYEGAGLGLALVQRLIALQGGTVTVESTFGEGSRFTVTLPCTDAARSPAALPVAAHNS
ncbi:MAG: HAMP domain-containing sensor histidine kinase [Caldilineaceae bacterium]